ncbi:MAG: hypothetical protein HYW48_03610 [Deltaproteobacteria bacterium]|nr:hypothetical protein [Deltaproteobacteria bacterium]
MPWHDSTCPYDKDQQLGILSLYRDLKKKRRERSIAKSLKLIQNPKAIREERASAIEFFKNLDDPQLAVPALLKRFDFSLDHGINDTREKESAMEGILRFKDAALPFVREHLAKSNRIAWPIKILQRLAEEAQTIEALEASLDFGEVDFDRDKVDKNYDVLCYLRDFQLPDQGKKLLRFLSAHDERVRFAVTEVILAQNAQEVAKHLEPFLLDESAENTRVRQTVIDAYLEKGWILSLPQIPEGPLAEGVAVSKDRKLKKA